MVQGVRRRDVGVLGPVERGEVWDGWAQGVAVCQHAGVASATHRARGWLHRNFMGCSP